MDFSLYLSTSSVFTKATDAGSRSAVARPPNFRRAAYLHFELLLTPSKMRTH